jgi:uncharacterized delta-60 repeat protein
MTWRTWLQSTLSNSSSRRPRSNTRRSVRRALFETLEVREVLAASISLGSGGGGWGLDGTFGSGGKVITPISSSLPDEIHDLAAHPAGGYVAVGRLGTDFAIARYDSNGVLDPSFDLDGIRTIDVLGLNGNDVARGVAVQPNGKIVVVGESGGGTNQFVVIRLNTDGSLDNSFHFDGYAAVADFGIESEQAKGVVIQPDGSIVVVGTIGESTRIGVARYQSSGSLDITFGGGTRTIDFTAGSTEEAAGVALDSTGRIVVAAVVDDGTQAVALARLSAGGGTVDGTFGGGPFVTSFGDGFSRKVESIAIDGTDRVVAVGTLDNGDSTDLFVLRYTTSGALDGSWDVDGQQTLDLGSDERGFDVAIQSDGKIVVAGTANGSGSDFLVARFDGAGAIDSTFSGGAIQTNFSGSDDVATSLVLENDGKIVLGGKTRTSSGTDNFALARYAQTGGPPPVFAINEGGSLTLTGTYATAAPGTATITINWGDGSSENVPISPIATSGSFTVTHTYLDDVPTNTPIDVNTITATINASDGTDADSTTATVSNVAPVVGPIGGPAAAVRGQSVAFTGSFSDVGTQDTHTVSWDFGDGVTTPFTPSTAPGALAPSHTYTTAGDYTVKLTVRDDDAGESLATRSITIVIAQLEPAACGCGTDLVIGGTGAGELIVVSPAGGEAVTLTIDNVIIGTFSPSHGIVAHAYAGDDTVEILSGISLAAWIYGGDGNDWLKGAAGHDMLQGGGGDDLLVGGAGRDLLIGGTGSDRIVGSSDDDILIAGTTDFDANPAALCQIMAEWTSDRSYWTRVLNLTIGSSCVPRENGSTFLTPATVHDDGVRDFLTGASGFDWFFANVCLDDDSPVKDKITDLSAWEFVRDIDFIES